MKSVVYSLSFVVALRFFGLFIVMPMLSLYAMGKSGSNPFLVGVVMGAYAISQLLFQIPFGVASDKIGRKGVIITGLLIFAAGSVICAVSSDIYGLLFGRLLQGVGAISSVVTAMISDFTPESKRGKAMAMMGGSIALAFAASMAFGPLVGGEYGVDKLFWLTAVLAVAAALYLALFIPEPPRIRHSAIEHAPRSIELFTDKNLVRMYANMFLHGFLMTIAFMLIPIELTTKFSFAANELWKVYIPAMLLGILAMAPAAILGEKYNKIKEVFGVSIALNTVAFLLFGAAPTAAVFVAATLLFFIGFNMLEPLLQSTTSKYAKASQRGAALGVFTTFQYLGVFVGGVVGGYLLHEFDLALLANVMGALSVLWFGYNLFMRNPLKASFLYLEIERLERETIGALRLAQGVVDSYINETEGVLVVKFDPSVTSEEWLMGFLHYKAAEQQEE